MMPPWHVKSGETPRLGDPLMAVGLAKLFTSILQQAPEKDRRLWAESCLATAIWESTTAEHGCEIM